MTRSSIRAGYALIAVFVLALAIFTTAAKATEFGIQDDGRSSDTICIAGDQIGGEWTRTTVSLGQHGVADRIRDAHRCGQKIILTIGGTGTRTRKPTAKGLLAYIRSLPRADKYTVINEPDLSGVKPCRYKSIWMTVRRTLGSRLLFGDFSPHRPLTYTQSVANCRGKRHLPKTVDFAVHPYWPTDPLVNVGPETAVDAAGSTWNLEGGMAQLVFARKWLRKNTGLRVRWWLDEFGYLGKTDDDLEAWLWSRARMKASAVGAKVLIAYTSKGSTWDTRPGPRAWCYLTRGEDCPAGESHRVPVEMPKPDEDEPQATIRLGDVMTAIKAYAS